MYDLQKFSPIVGCLFTLFMVFFEAQIFFIWMKSHLSIFPFVACGFGVIYKKLFLNASHEDLTLCFLLRVLCLAVTFKVLNILT